VKHTAVASLVRLILSDAGAGSAEAVVSSCHLPWSCISPADWSAGS